jgi:hypothetical protein
MRLGSQIVHEVSIGQNVWGTLMDKTITRGEGGEESERLTIREQRIVKHRRLMDLLP